MDHSMERKGQVIAVAINKVTAYIRSALGDCRVKKAVEILTLEHSPCLKRVFLSLPLGDRAGEISMEPEELP
jgi:hypothetical protein